MTFDTSRLRIDVCIRAIDLNVHAFLQTLTHIMPSFFSIRKVQLYAELLDYSHDDDSGPYKTGGGSWGDFDTYEDNYEDRIMLLCASFTVSTTNSRN
jgi:hypothetical protein